RALAMRIASLNPTHFDLARSYLRVGQSLAAGRDDAAAEPHLREAARLLDMQPSIRATYLLAAQRDLAAGLARQGRVDEAAALLLNNVDRSCVLGDTERLRDNIARLAHIGEQPDDGPH